MTSTHDHFSFPDIYNFKLHSSPWYAYTTSWCVIQLARSTIRLNNRSTNYPVSMRVLSIWLISLLSISLSQNLDTQRVRHGNTLIEALTPNNGDHHCRVYWLTAIVHRHVLRDDDLSRHISLLRMNRLTIICKLRKPLIFERRSREKVSVRRRLWYMYSLSARLANKNAIPKICAPPVLIRLLLCHKDNRFGVVAAWKSAGRFYILMVRPSCSPKITYCCITVLYIEYVS